jgi:hypothetical protein
MWLMAGSHKDHDRQGSDDITESEGNESLLHTSGLLTSKGCLSYFASLQYEDFELLTMVFVISRRALMVKLI